MSLLADLLSKIKHSPPKGEIPPNLKNIVNVSARQSAYKKKIILISVFSVVSIISGILIVNYLSNLTGVKDNNMDMTIDTPIEMAAKIDEQVQTGEGLKNLPSELGKEAEKDKSVSGESSDEKIEEAKDDVKTEKTQLSKTYDEKKAIAKEIAEYPQSSRLNASSINAPKRDAYLYSAREHEMKKNYPKALSNYKKALEIEKNNFTIMNNIAYILLQLGFVDASIKYSQMAVDIKKDYTPALINLGVAYAKVGNNTAAEIYLNRAFVLEPDNQSVILNLAILYEKQKDYHNASRYFRMLTHLGNITGFLGLARIYEKDGKIEEALKIYKNIYSFNSIDNKTRQLVGQRIILLSEN